MARFEVDQALQEELYKLPNWVKDLLTDKLGLELELNPSGQKEEEEENADHQG